MDYRVLEFDRGELYNDALEHFKSAAKITWDGGTSNLLWNEALSVYETGKEDVFPKVILSKLNLEDILSSGIWLGSSQVCQSFMEKLNKEQKCMDDICGVYAFLLTVGSCSVPSDAAVSKQYFADLWGTAFVDALRDCLSDKILKNHGTCGNVVRTVLPGFYGIPLSTNNIIYDVLCGWEIGLEINASGVFLPEKSSAGFYFVVPEHGDWLESGCKACQCNRFMEH